MRVVVVEDQILFREFLVSLLEDQLKCEVVGIAGDGHEALDVIRKTRPKLILLDILIPKLSGIHVAKTVQKELPSARILALSAEMDNKTLMQVHHLRLSGFIDKNEASVEILTEAINRVGSGKVFFSPTMREAVRKMRIDPKGFQKILTPREQEVLTLIGAGLSDETIGEQLGLTTLSAHSHRQNLLIKLDLHSTPELMRFASESGFWKPEFPKMELDDTYHLHD